MIEFFPGNTWIFGDSYGVKDVKGWSGYLESRMDLGNFINRCVGGSSVPDAYFEIMRALKLDSISSKDRVILVISEKHRVFRNNDRTMTKAWGDRELMIFNNLLYTACLRDAVAELAKRDIRTLLIWAFPSNWPGDNNLFIGHIGLATWDDEFKDIDPDDYGYFDGVEDVDQIRPALYYFSARECPPKVMATDPRPNHIEDQALHRKLTDIVASWIIGQWQGVRDLRSDDAVQAKTLKQSYAINEKKKLEAIGRMEKRFSLLDDITKPATGSASQTPALTKVFRTPEVIRDFKFKKWKPKKKQQE